MAEQDIAEWTPAQVADWVSGLEPPACGYAAQLAARGLTGRRLLALRCDDLDVLGVRALGHQELLLEAAELLRHYYYESRRESVARLALLASASATALARGQAAAPQARLDTQTLADVSLAVRGALRLARRLGAGGAGGGGAWGGELRAELLRLALVAATSAQRDRFAEQPARAVGRAAGGIARLADYLLQDTQSPELVSDGVGVWARGRALAPLAARPQLAQVGGTIVVGWRASAVRGLVARGAGRGTRGLIERSLALSPEPPPPPSPRGSSSSDSELSPPASPHTHRLMPDRPVRLDSRRRHSVSGGSPRAPRPPRGLDQLWHELSRRRSPYRRDKASSCTLGAPAAPPGPPPPARAPRAPLDKAHSTPAYARPAPPHKEEQILGFKKSSEEIEEAIQLRGRRQTDEPSAPAPATTSAPAPVATSAPVPAATSAPEPAATSAPVPVATSAPAPAATSAPESTPSPASAPSPVSEYPPLRAVRREEPAGAASPTALKPLRGAGGAAALISLPLRAPAGARALPPLNAEPAPAPAGPAPAPAPASALRPAPAPAPALSKKGNKKTHTLLAKGRSVPLWAVLPAAARAGGAWQRVRRGAGPGWRWAARRLLLLHPAHVLLAYRPARPARAAALLRLRLATCAPAPEVKSRAHAWKVYHLGSCFYFASDTRADMLDWLAHLQPAAGAPSTGDESKQFSETEYSDGDSDEGECERDREPPRERERDKDKDKSKFNSLKKLTTRSAGAEAASGAGAGAGAASLDRKTLRSIFTRWNRDERAGKRGAGTAPPPAEHYRRAPPPARPAPPAPPPAPPLHHIHASNPNLLDFHQELPRAPPLPRPAARGNDTLAGFITLEQFMLSKQREELRQVYSNRVLLGIERDGEGDTHHERDQDSDTAHSTPPAGAGASHAVTSPGAGAGAGEAVTSPGAMLAELDKYWLTALRRNDRVHGAGSSPGKSQADSGGGGGGSPSGMTRLRNMFTARRRDEPHAPPALPGAAWPPQYPHLPYPPTFEPEVYSLTAPPRPHPRPPH